MLAATLLRSAVYKSFSDCRDVTLCGCNKLQLFTKCPKVPNPELDVTYAEGDARRCLIETNVEMLPGGLVEAIPS